MTLNGQNQKKKKKYAPMHICQSLPFDSKCHIMEHGHSIVVNHGPKICLCIDLVGKSRSGSEPIFGNFTM